MEKIIAYHCAPALAGIKPSNLVTCYKNKDYDINSEIERLNFQLNNKDIYFEAICECEKRVLIMVYRKNAIAKTLDNPDTKKFLMSFGYPEAFDVDEYIEILKNRCKDAEFPHEIGIFLGYPLHDVYGFMFHKNEGCLLCGEWKVYENPEEAKKLFARFSACRKALVKRIMAGRTLEQMFCAI